MSRGRISLSTAGTRLSDGCCKRRSCASFRGMLIVIARHDRESASILFALGKAGIAGQQPIVELRLVWEPTLFEGGLRRWGALQQGDFRRVPVFLQFDTAVDAASFGAARRVTRKVLRNFSSVDGVVVGDVSGPKALLATALAAKGIPIFLAPEGTSVFRGLFGDLPWRYLGRANAIGHRANRALALARSLRLTPVRRLPGLVALCRSVLVDTIALLMASPQRPEEARLAEVHTLISSWPGSAKELIRHRNYISIDLNSENERSLPQEKGLAVFLHTPVKVSSAMWVEVLSVLPPDIRRVIIKSHRVLTGLDELESAVIHLGLDCEVIRSAIGLESMSLGVRPEFFIGVTSTALLNLASHGLDTRIISVARTLERSLSVAGDRRGEHLFGTPLRALERFGVDRIEFL